MAEDVVQEVEAKKGKGLAILFDSNSEIPGFVFTGDWYGRDVLRIKRLINREYRRYQREVRKDLDKVKTEKGE